MLRPARKTDCPERLSTPDDILAAFLRLAAEDPAEARHLQTLISGTQIVEMGMSMADEQRERERLAAVSSPHRTDAAPDGTTTTITFPGDLVAGYHRGEVSAQQVQSGARRGGRT